jgi:hypothetical protein
MLREEVEQQYMNRDPCWSADLMVELENKRLGMALDWAIDSLKALVENTLPSYQQEALKWLTELASMPENPSRSSDLMEKCQQIWSKERDIIHTAIAHLYAAAAILAERNISMYRRSLVSAMNVMGDHDFYRRTSVAIPLTLFDKFMAA